MPLDCTLNLPATRAMTSGELVPIPLRRISLKTLFQVRREMASVYREMRAGSIESQDGTRYVYVLAQVGKMIEQSELERRVAQLEANRGK
jgi:hypothetical protein